VSLPEVPGFRVSGRLGAGAAGTVWSATRDSDGRSFALKLVPAAGGRGAAPGDAVAGEGEVDQAVREAHLLAGIEHPHVVRLHAATALDDGTVALVLDLVDGGSYAAVVSARGHLHPGEIVTALAPVTRAVADLHALGVVHADLSPGNVLFTRQGRPMVSDLGVATLFGELPEVLHATEGFVAPEVMLGEPPTPASDVYSLGALAWFGLTGGAPPLPALRPPLADVVDGQPARLLQLVERCLAADAGARPTAASVALDLFDAAPAEPVQLGEGSDPASSITHRIRASARLDPPPERVGLRARLQRRRTGRAPAPGRGPVRVPGRRGHRPGGRRARGEGPPRTRGPLRPAAAGAWLTVLLAVVLGGGTGIWVHHFGASTPQATTRSPLPRPPLTVPVPTASPARRVPTAVRAELRSSPRAVLQRLADARARAYRAADVRLLDGADVAGSPSRARHEKLLRQAAAAGATYDGLRYVVREATVSQVRGDEATLRARVDTSAHTVVGRDGSRDGRAATTGAPVTIELRWTNVGWRIYR